MLFFLPILKCIVFTFFFSPVCKVVKDLTCARVLCYRQDTFAPQLVATLYNQQKTGGIILVQYCMQYTE